MYFCRPGAQAEPGRTQSHQRPGTCVRPAREGTLLRGRSCWSQMRGTRERGSLCPGRESKEAPCRVTSATPLLACPRCAQELRSPESLVSQASCWERVASVTPAFPEASQIQRRHSRWEGTASRPFTQCPYVPRVHCGPGHLTSVCSPTKPVPQANAHESIRRTQTEGRSTEQRTGPPENGQGWDSQGKTEKLPCLGAATGRWRCRGGLHEGVGGEAEEIQTRPGV